MQISRLQLFLPHNERLYGRQHLFTSFLCDLAIRHFSGLKELDMYLFWDLQQEGVDDLNAVHNAPGLAQYSFVFPCPFRQGLCWRTFDKLSQLVRPRITLWIVDSKDTERDNDRLADCDTAVKLREW